MCVGIIELKEQIQKVNLEIIVISIRVRIHIALDQSQLGIYVNI